MRYSSSELGSSRGVIEGWPERIGALLLAIGLVLGHVPLSVASAASELGSPVGAPSSEPAAPSLLEAGEFDACCASLRAPSPTPSPTWDSCCPAPEPVVSATDPCCDSEESEGDDPCCPDGCRHCSKSCCSASPAMICPGASLAIELGGASQVTLPLPGSTAAARESIFHPPRG